MFKKLLRREKKSIFVPTDKQLQVMRLIGADKVYWERRNGGSNEYKQNMEIIRELISYGAVFWVEDGCCRKDFMLTKEGMELIKAG